MSVDLVHPSGFADRLDALLDEAELARSGSRREAGSDRPLGPKATRTREAILHAGIEVFLEQGYAASTVAHVHERAGVSLGTYYQYFRDRSDLITTIVADAVVTSARTMFVDPELDAGADGVARTVEAYVTHYANTAAFQAVWEEVTHLEPAVATFRHRLAELLELSLAESLARGQVAGTVDTDLDPGLAARALAAMADRTCYLTFVADRRGRRAIPMVRDTLSRLWTNALRPGSTT